MIPADTTTWLKLNLVICLESLRKTRKSSSQDDRSGTVPPGSTVHCGLYTASKDVRGITLSRRVIKRAGCREMKRDCGKTDLKGSRNGRI
jgi:hypothetical protein